MILLSIITFSGMALIDFVRLEDGRLVDARPMDKGKLPLVLTEKGWVSFPNVTGDDLFNSIPLEEEEINSPISAGIIGR